MIARTASCALAALLALPAGGCLSKSVSEPIRYFRPLAPEEATRPVETAAARDPAPLRLRRVEAASHLGARVARRTSDVEVGFDDLVRWTDPPATFLERALAHELFETRGLARSEAGSAPRLDVNLLAFEEVRAPERAATVAAHVSLLGDAAMLERTYTAQAPVRSGDPADLARAIGAALAEVVRAIGRDVEAALRAAKRS